MKKICAIKFKKLLSKDWGSTIIICSFLFTILVTALGCTAAGMERTFGMGDCTVEMYSGGKLVQTWESNGRVKSEDNSDGWYFKDKSTGKLVIVTGDIVIKNN